MGKAFYSSPLATEVKFYIRQQAIGAIIRVLEAAARSGVLCRMRNCTGKEVDVLLMPRLMAMNIDQPEAQLFFGMSNRQSCSKCRRRKGYGALRHGSFQRRSEIKLLYRIWGQEQGDVKVTAGEKLVRRGFRPDRKCCLLELGDALYIRPPKVTGGVEVFPGLDFRDRMHGLIMFTHKILVKILNEIKWTTKQGVSQKSILDQRLCQVVSSRALREPLTGKVYNPGKTMFSTADMSAKQKKACIFCLPHVFGPDGKFFPTEVRDHMLQAIARIQLMIIASTGRRQYTEAEFVQIFDKDYTVMIRTCEHVFQLSHDRKFTDKMKAHLKKPDEIPRPKPYKRKTRGWDNHTTPESETEDTSDELRVPGVGKFTHGDFNLTHQHWVLQIVNSGYFGVHDTEAAEAHHKKCMRLPAERVRHFGPRRTQESMLRYLMKGLVFDELKKLVLPARETIIQTSNASVGLPLTVVCNRRVCKLTMGHHLDSVAVQESVLHEHVRLARVELLDLMCAKLNMPRTQRSYTVLENLDWSFGQKMIMTGGGTYWATDSAYSWYSDEDARNRRDCFILEGAEPTTVTQPGGRQVRLETALCCQAVCFVKLTNIDSVRRRIYIPYDIECEINGDSLILALVRWFEPHPTAISRDSQCRPVCPGMFSINHCLWRYALSPKVWSVLIDGTGEPTIAFTEQQHMFGKSAAAQLRRLENEKNAYYDLIKPSSIKSIACMCPVFEESLDWHTCGVNPTSTWMQTVTLC